MKAHRSSSDRHATHAARDIDGEGVLEVVGFSLSSIWTVQVVRTHVFLLGQLRTRLLRSKGLKVRRAQVVLWRKWSQGTGTLNDIGSALKRGSKTNVLEGREY